jgi:tryptophan halogenase
MKSITIVGGGSAGWMTASTLIKFFPNKKITLIESPNTPTVGVGESTLEYISRWARLLEIDEKHFLKHTDGSYKLSIKFTDFYKKGEAFHYPFGNPVLMKDSSGLNDWWFKKFLKPKTPHSDYVDSFYPQMHYINNNKFSPEFPKAYHFDATKFGVWLRDNYCIPRGVKHIKEDINTIEQNEEGIISLNKKYKADLFIDCTGFKSLLLGETLKEEFISYQDLLPNDSAWATRMPYKNKEKELVSYTNCTAIENGWIWNIPLWSRIGTGYVYSSKFISDEDALKEFQNYLGNKDLEFKNIKMRVGIHKRLWVKNVCAIGLAAGFIEPLESNGLFSVHEFLINLVRNLQREKISQFDKDNFTYYCRQIFQNFSEFVALHYALSHRDDTPYWRSHLNKEWSSSLINRIPSLSQGIDAAVIHRGFLHQHDYNGGLHCIAAGMHWGPTDMISILKEHDKNFIIPRIKETVVNLENRQKEWNINLKKTPTLLKYLDKVIHYKK